jgi:UDP-N-acetylmuramoyl-tripeptide--D-alanyl-D-alanine ligase
MLDGAFRTLVRGRDAWREGRVLQALHNRWLRHESALWRWSRLAHLYRRLLPRRIAFIGVTGSCGKTTTVRLVAKVLGTRHTGQATPVDYKSSPFLERTVVATRRRDGFCIIEMTIKCGGRLVFDETLALIRPSIGIVTVIGSDHLSIFRSPEATAEQKGRLVECLPHDGTAVLNADNPLVRKMARRTRARVFTYGLAEDAMLRATNVRARWPERLSFSVHYEGRTAEVRTQLCGAHVVSNVLAALATGVAIGIPLEEAAGAVASMPPIEPRLYPVDHPDGFTIVRDDYKAPLWSIPAALDFVREATASRKVIVFGTISDYAGPSDRTYHAVARQALEVADRVVFVGSHSVKALKAAPPDRSEALQAFYSADAAAEHLHTWLAPGDLVLLKGSTSDELERIVTTTKQSPRRKPFPSASGCQVLAGLGNPGGAYRDAPHNVGYRVLDLVANALGATWSDQFGAQIARADGVLLLKPATWMNVSGPRLAALAERLGFGPADLILVHDDVDLPIRSVRVRTRSGDGGHGGVRSVLRAFRTDEIRRVRVGVGRSGSGEQVEKFVVRPFDAASLPAVHKACIDAADQALELLGRSERIRVTRARARARAS